MVRFAEVEKYGNLINGVSSKFFKDFPNVDGASVFIKPNLVSPRSRWDYPSTTHVKVIELVIQKLVEGKAKHILIGDCGFKDQWEATMQSTRYDQLVKKYNVEIIPLQDGPNFHMFTLRRLDKYRSLYGVKFSNFVLGCDMVINVPKMKVHCMAGVTGAIKNMMGTMAQKGSMHPKADSKILHKRLADLYELTKTMVQFIVMDGIVGSEFSEQCGRPVESGVLISGTDQWEVDVAATKLMGINPKQIDYLRYIRTDFDSVQVPEHLIKTYEMPLSYRR